MQLDDLLQRYFATTDLSGVATDTFAAGIEHGRVDLGLEEDRGKRFALWTFLHMFGSTAVLEKEHARGNSRRRLETPSSC